MAGTPESTIHVETTLDPEAVEALKGFTEAVKFGRDDKGRFIRNDATQVQLITELAKAIVLLASGENDRAAEVALSVMEAAEQADAGTRGAEE